MTDTDALEEEPKAPPKKRGVKVVRHSLRALWLLLRSSPFFLSKKMSPRHHGLKPACKNARP